MVDDSETVKPDEVAHTSNAQECYDAGCLDGRRLGWNAALDAVDKYIAALIPHVSPGELRLGEVQELRAAVAALKA